MVAENINKRFNHMNTKETQEAAFVDAQHRLVAELPDSFFYLRHGKTTDNQAEIISGESAITNQFFFLNQSKRPRV